METTTIYEHILSLIHELYANPSCNRRKSYLFINSVIFDHNAEGDINGIDRARLEKFNRLYYRNYTGSKEYPN